MNNKQTIEIYVNGELQEKTRLNLKYIEEILKIFRRLNNKQQEEDTAKNYESVCIFDPKISIEDLENTIEELKNNIKECKKIERLGIKKLAYKIGNCNEGYYITFDFIATDNNIQALERHQRINSNIIKFINLKKD